MSETETGQRVVTIQPAELPGKVRPKPYHVLARGMIGRQDYWRGCPLQLVGFQRDLAVVEVDVGLEGFLADPQAVVGTYAVFMNADGDFETLENPIESVRDHLVAEPL